MAPIAAPLPRPIDSSFGARFFSAAQPDVASTLLTKNTMTLLFMISSGSGE